MKEVLQFLKDNPTFFLATVEGTHPRVRPFGAVCEFEGRLYLVTSNQKPVFKQIQDNPEIEICGMNAEGVWVRISATAVSDPREAPKVAILEDYPMMKQMYHPADGKMEVIYLQDAVATFCSFTANPKTIKF